PTLLRRTDYSLLSLALLHCCQKCLQSCDTRLPCSYSETPSYSFYSDCLKSDGFLLFHLVLECISSVMIGLVWWVHFHARRRVEVLPSYRLAVEFLGVGLVALTGYLGGFLSGVNTPG